ncbi:Transcription factor SOX-3 [Oopsacas minuta]|uniref:Sex-determining region Y protein n=1 Tax=Oopsacas minuta TaxID=111878 RepID=A0AAV7K172_9METZ|nr:Transcription factor SOX-3 [Oopsacas minuta]
MDTPLQNLEVPGDLDRDGTVIIDEKHVKRPMNAFMVWARDARRKIAQENPKLHNAEISKQLGVSWRELSDEDKSPFRIEAKRIRETHIQKYPQYRYKPRKKKLENLNKLDKHNRDGHLRINMDLSSRAKRPALLSQSQNLFSDQFKPESSIPAVTQQVEYINNGSDNYSYANAPHSFNQAAFNLPHFPSYFFSPYIDHNTGYTPHYNPEHNSIHSNNPYHSIPSEGYLPVSEVKNWSQNPPLTIRSPIKPHDDSGSPTYRIISPPLSPSACCVPYDDRLYLPSPYAMQAGLPVEFDHQALYKRQSLSSVPEAHQINPIYFNNHPPSLHPMGPLHMTESSSECSSQDLQ